MKRLLLALISLTCFTTCLHCQLLIWTPDFAKADDAITITMDATKGNQGLNNYSDPNDVYVHIGVITNLSSNSDDWKHSPFVWATTAPQAKAVSLGNNKYSYTISNITTFFTPLPGESIQKIGILFRNGNGSQAQRNADNSNMYIPVYDNTIAVRFAVPSFQPKFVPEPEPFSKAAGDNIVLTAISNKPATLNLYLNGTLIQTAAAATTISANPALAAGNTTIIAEAIEGVVSKKDSVKFFVSGGIVTAPLPAGVKNGINYLPGNTSVVLVLYAPGKSRVNVIGEFPGSNWTEQSTYQMNQTPDGNYWWLQINNLISGTEYAYQYLVDGVLKIADPYTEKVLDPYNNNDQHITAATYPGLKSYPAGLTSGIVSILQTNAPAYTWTNNSFAKPDKRNLFIYELLVRDFVAAHDWKTLKDTLSYLKRLGINAIELMPFNEFEGNESWGYNPDFYFAPDKYYGPKNTLKEFIDSCHSNGIAVVMDIALNHSFGLSPLVQLYFDAANNRPDITNPWFNSVAKHPYNVGYDMNHESPATNYYFSRVVAHWLNEYKIDGFRFDLSKGFTQKNSCTTGNCDSDPEVGSWSNYDASRVAIWKKYYDTLQLKSPGSYVILEHFAANDEDRELSDYGMLLWGNMNYNFNEASMGWTSTSNFEGGLYSVRNWTKPHLVTYMESHDEERLLYKNIKFGNSTATYNTRDTATALKRLEMCAAFLMSMPGPKMIWQFGELGYDYPINYCIDNGTVDNACRTGKKPIRWDYKLQARRQQLYDVYSNISKLRYHSFYKDVFIANNITIERSLADGFKWLKLRSALDSSQILVAGNFDVTAQTGTIVFPTAGVWYDYLGGGGTISATGTAQNITLQPGEYHVYLNRNLTNNTPTPVFTINDPLNELRAAVYPNPMNGRSLLELMIPEKGMVQIHIYNMTGTQVKTIFSGNLPKGIHFLPVLEKINNLAAGMYLLRIQAKNHTRSLKILVQ